jgi:hypothetical protein
LANNLLDPLSHWLLQAMADQEELGRELIG